MGKRNGIKYMKKSIHRRQFLKKGATSIGTLAIIEAFSGFSPVLAAFAKTDKASTIVKVLSSEQRGEKTMKVLGINGSARKDGNTTILIKEVFKELQQAGIETELVLLADQVIEPCRACFACAETGKCVQNGDAFNAIFDNMIKAQGIILASPVYSADVSSRMKALIERAAVVGDMRPELLKYKVGSSIAVARRAGTLSTLDTMNHFFLNHSMFVCGSSYWNFGYGRLPGDILSDNEGIETMKNLGKNMAFILKAIGNVQ